MGEGVESGAEVPLPPRGMGGGRRGSAAVRRWGGRSLKKGVATGEILWYNGKKAPERGEGERFCRLGGGKLPRNAKNAENAYRSATKFVQRARFCV